MMELTLRADNSCTGLDIPERKRCANFLMLEFIVSEFLLLQTSNRLTVLKFIDNEFLGFLRFLMVPGRPTF